MIVGIDPGSVSGAYAVVDNNGQFVACGDLPTTPFGGTGKLQINPALLAKLLREIRPDLAIVERVGAFPGQGSSSGFRFGQASGIVLGALGALSIPFLLVMPGKWKRDLGLGKVKDHSRTMALQHFPEAAPFLERKKDHGRGDALCIAYWQYRKGSV